MSHALTQSLTVQIADKHVIFAVRSETSDFDVPFTELLFNLTQVEEELILEDNGYEKTDKISDTLQGELMNGLDNENNPITIKKCDKVLVEKHLSFPDDYNMEYFVEDDIIK